MKKIIASVVLAAVLVTASQAQEVRDREKMKNRMMQRYHRSEEFKKLNLSDDQKEKLRKLQDEHRQQMSELRKNENVTVKEWRNKMETERKDHRAKVQGLLTEEQKAQLERARQEKRVQWQQRAEARSERMKTDLALSNEQSAKLKSSREALAQKMKGVREDKSLTDEAKKEKVRELMKNQKEEMRSILTEEQLKKLQEQKKKRPVRRKIV